MKEERFPLQFKPGEYKGIGMTLRIYNNQPCLNAIEVTLKDGPTLRWFFNTEGKFEMLSADTAAVKQPKEDIPSALVVCPHIVPGYTGGVILSKASSDVDVGWACCPLCIEEMLSGGSRVEVMDRGVAEKVLSECSVLEVTRKGD